MLKKFIKFVWFNKKNLKMEIPEISVRFMEEAKKEADKGVMLGDGGPFGAVVVKDGEIIARAHNEVIKTQDPTAHAEVTAIRRASKALNRFNLEDCELYTSSEPCPMCFAAVHWAKMTKMYYGCSVRDAAEYGFDDRYIYEVIAGTAKSHQVQTFQVGREICLEPFKQWNLSDRKVSY